MRSEFIEYLTVAIALVKCACTAKQSKENMTFSNPCRSDFVPVLARGLSPLVNVGLTRLGRTPHVPTYACTYCEKTRLPGVTKQAYGAEWALQGRQKASEGDSEARAEGGWGHGLHGPRQGVIEGLQRLSLLCKNTIELIEILKRISWG